MSEAIHFMAKTVLGVSGSAACVSPYYSGAPYKNPLRANHLSLHYTLKNSLSVCNASPGGHRRNPDFSGQNKHGFSRRMNRQNDYRDHYENLEESEVFSSKNGPLLTSSGSPKFQASSTPGPTEKEIVELFRKIQAQLKEIAAAKEERKAEESQKKGKESETVDSLLRLLRKHSVQKGKRSSDRDSSRDFFPEQTERNDMFSSAKITGMLDSTISQKTKKTENLAPVSSRPISNFCRRSPVPQVKAQPVYTDEEAMSSISQANFHGNGEQRTLEPEVEAEAESDNEVALSDGEVFDDVSDDEISEIYEDKNLNESHQNEGMHSNLRKLKLADLRALAKSRGLKGFSKLKKQELVDLLSEGRV